jgi:hypothetical protein
MSGRSNAACGHLVGNPRGPPPSAHHAKAAPKPVTATPAGAYDEPPTTWENAHGKGTAPCPARGPQNRQKDRHPSRSGMDPSRAAAEHGGRPVTPDEHAKAEAEETAYLSALLAATDDERIAQAAEAAGVEPEVLRVALEGGL